MAADGIVQFTTDIINDTISTTKTTYSSDKIDKLLKNVKGKCTEVILGCFDSTATPSTVPTTFVKDDQYYDVALNKIFKATSNTAWDGGNTPTEDIVYLSIDDNKIYAYVKGVWGIYGGNDTKVSAKTNNIVKDLTGQTNANDNGLYVPLSKKSGNIIDNLTGQTSDINNGLFVGKSAKAYNALQKLTGQTNASEDGLYVEDLNPKINKLDLTTKLNEIGATEYIYLKGTDTTATSVNSTDSVMKHLAVSETNLENNRYDANTGFLRLKAGITYEMEACVLSVDAGTLNYWFKDETNNKQLGNTALSFVGDIADTSLAKCIVTPETDIDVSIKINKNADLYLGYSYVSVVAINSLTIDPLQYVDNVDGTQDTPVGTIISVMGINAPKHYLKADGAEYNIKDYPYLAKYFKEQFGAVNKFGGDGITKFKVPNLQGEFLRGTGTNPYTNPTTGMREGSGPAVGTHQPSTYTPMVYYYDNGSVVYPVATSNANQTNQTTLFDTQVSNTGRFRDVAGVGSQNSRSNGVGGTIKPTNTSVLWCIKAEPTYFVNVVGTTIEEQLSDYVEVTTTGLVDIPLSESIEDYDELLITVQCYYSNRWLGTTQTRLEVSEINYNSNATTGSNGWDSVDESYVYFPAYKNGIVNTIGGCFRDANTFRATECNKTDTSVVKMRMKVKGIKKTSKIQGGSFGGGSMNPDCDCGTLTTSDIATAVNSTKTILDT